MAALAQSGAAADGTPKSAAGQALAVVARGRTLWAGMAPARRNRLLAMGAVLLALLAGVSWWGSRTEWKTLYAGLDGRDVQQVQAELAAAGISYQPTPDGQGVQVPAELLDKARMEVASKGMPQSGRMGFELFDKPNWVGSEFDEKVNYQRALEGELENTIATLGAVRSARVHLVLPKDSLFTSEQQPAKASVVLKLKRSTLSKEEIESVRGLVAAAVEGLQPDQVTLVDADGRLNLGAQDRSGAARDEEGALEEKIVALLEPLAGRDNVRATVNVSYDTSTQERTDEVVDPSQVATLSSQRSDQSTGPGARVGGIPGTVSNAPAPAATGSAAAATQGSDKAGDKAAERAQLPVFPAGSAQGQSAHEETSTFAVTRHTSHEEVGPGRIARITAAVLVNDRSSEGGTVKDPHMVWKPRTADEMKRLEELAQAAVGFDTKRGDTVVMQNISFQGNVPVVQPAGLARTAEQAQAFLRAQPELLRTLAAGVLAAMFILMVRPVAKQTMVMLREPLELGAGRGELRLGAGGQRERLSLSGAEGAAARLEGRSMQSGSTQLGSAQQVSADAASADAGWGSAPASQAAAGARPRGRRLSAIDNEGVLEYVAEHVRREPGQSTRLLEGWIGGMEEGR